MCEDKIIGISKDGSCCLESSESLSGFYLDDMDEGYIPVEKSLYQSETASDILLKLISNATSEVKRELDKKLGKYLNARFGDVTSMIGNSDIYTDIIPEAVGKSPYLAIKPKNIKGGYIRINSIKIFTNGIFNGIVKILNENKEELFNNTLVNFEPMYLPLNQNYYITYNPLTSPYNFTHVPCCTNLNKYSPYVEIGSGVAELNNLSQIQFVVNPFCQGIEVDANFGCSSFDSLCSIDFQKSKFGVSFAHAVKQTARKNFAYWILTSLKSTTYVKLSQEEILSLIEFLKKDIEENLNYLPFVYNISDCYVCKDLIKKAEILI
jgi:hypothetical protein